uniref:RHS repeat-associated core domain-containing protein n=1 Tax=Humidesulfovibrio mexicanus TaxID=147047 RepID=UPI000B76D39C|nr:RHS repeat-associated core domain-containing protein [Humidesulfovibrio mexicanus]
MGQAGATQYGHDKAGFRNLKLEGGRETRYHYEPGGLLMGVDLPDGRRIDYAYDADGLRREKRINGRLVEAYRWLDPLRLSEFHDEREWWRLAYLEGRTPVGVTNGDDSYLLLCDQVGTPLALATTDGHVVQTMQYDSFGNLLQVRGDVVRLPIGFAGGLFDADTGLTRFGWRDYDADTGRFTALDPMGAKGGDSDWYGYCVDDPVNRVDAWGLDWGWADVASYGSTIATEALKQAKVIGTKVATGVGILTAPLGDMLDPTPVNDVYEESKEYWDQWGKEPEDLRNRH